MPLYAAVRGLGLLPGPGPAGFLLGAVRPHRRLPAAHAADPLVPLAVAVADRRRAHHLVRATALDRRPQGPAAGSRRRGPDPGPAVRQRRDRRALVLAHLRPAASRLRPVQARHRAALSTYNYLGEIDDQEDVPLFDEVDRLCSTNGGPRRRWSTACWPSREGRQEGSAREIFLFELARRYSFDDRQPLQISEIDRSINTSQGPLEALVRFNPTERTSVKFEADYSTLFSGLQSTRALRRPRPRQGQPARPHLVHPLQPETRRDARATRCGSAARSPCSGISGSRARSTTTSSSSSCSSSATSSNFAQQCYGVRLEMRDFRAERGSQHARQGHPVLADPEERGHVPGPDQPELGSNEP